MKASNIFIHYFIISFSGLLAVAQNLTTNTLERGSQDGGSCRSWTRIAEVLDLAQPAIKKAISYLEPEIDGRVDNDTVKYMAMAIKPVEDNITSLSSDIREIKNDIKLAKKQSDIILDAISSIHRGNMIVNQNIQSVKTDIQEIKNILKNRTYAAGRY